MSDTARTQRLPYRTVCSWTPPTAAREAGLRLTPDTAYLMGISIEFADSGLVIEGDAKSLGSGSVFHTMQRACTNGNGAAVQHDER
jgi:hypothetical protein